MCGIAGIFRPNGEAVSSPVLRQMTDTMVHRGPDGEGYWVDGFIGFGHRRLAILDLTDAAHQPMHSDDGQAVLCYNGEVYNFRELRHELEELGFSFHSTGDTEVVLNAYRAWGPDCVHRLNGMFAFAIWDVRRQTLFAARDRYGIKPLYYCYVDGMLVFASEIKALLQYPAVRRGVDPFALLEYFTFQNVFTDRTLFDGIKMLSAGHTLELCLGDTKPPSTQQFWDFDFRDPDKVRDPREYEEELDRLFRQAVCRQLVSDVPVGAFLSSGLDSGAITAVAAKEIPNLATFTCGFDLSSASGMELSFDEREKAEALSYQFKTEHYEVVMKAGDMERVLPNLVYHLEDLRVGQCYPNYYVSRLASKFVKVVLAGTGGDELFGGYPWRYFRAMEEQSYDQYTQGYYLYWQRLVPNRVIHRLFQPHIWAIIKDTLTIDIFADVMNRTRRELHTPEQYVNQSLYLECKTFLHGLLVVEDKLTMAHGLESRVPFLDNDVVEFAMRVPVASKLSYLDPAYRIDENQFGQKTELYSQRTNDGKLILRNVLGRYLPEAIADGKKQGFSAPDASWFRGDSMDYVRALVLDSEARIYEYLRPDTVGELVSEHLSGRRNNRLFIWSVLCFEWWLRSFLSAA
ncbi:asparagine synthase (glutamine-hydrolyzing) [Candidatus Latescibacterota bacterium]